MKLVGVGFSIFVKAVTAVIGGQLLSDAARFVQLFEDMFGGFRARAETTYALLRDPGSSFVVVATCQADALREAAYFADRLTSENMPLAGLVLNRTHPPLVDLPPSITVPALEAAVADSSRAKGRVLARAALQIHVDKVALHAEENRMRARFEGAHPEIGVIPVPALPTDVHDLSGLRTLAAMLAR
jgi:anion-transporting  ArsA/GET3 family ATPase